MKLMASLAPARAEVEAGAVAKADQYISESFFVCLSVSWAGIQPKLPKTIFKILHMPCLC